MATVDPVTFSVIWGGLLSASAEMGSTLERTAYSVVVREGSDFSTGIFDANGRMVAQGDYSPGHLGSMAYTVNRMLDYYDLADFKPGDAIICNDPGIGSGHLPDIFMVSPVFHAGRLIGYAVNIAHHADIGGGSAGGQEIVGISETYQEGLRLLPVKLFDGGVAVEDMFRLIRGNVRVPEVLGDLRAQYASNMTAAARMQALAAQYGPDVLAQAMDEIIGRTETAMREAIAALPKGTFRFVDHLDDTGPDTEPVRFEVAITISDDKVVCDWTGTSEARPAGINCYLQYTRAYCLVAVKAATLPSLPQNQGALNCIEVIAPLGSYVNPHPDTASGGRAINSHRLYEVLMGALAQAVPDRVIPANAHFFNTNIGGRKHPRTGKPFVAWDIVVGGVGARADRDGQEATSSPWNGTNIPIEAQEISNPVVVERVELIPDSAGPAKFRGGMGMRKDVRMLAETSTLYNLGDRHRFAPYGLLGGEPAALGSTLLNPGTPAERVLASKGTYELKKGDVISWRTSGAGGFGRPFERDPAAVLKDVRAGLISVAAAQRDYAVVVAGDAVDQAATVALRRQAAALAPESSATA
jgi:N-methylhydantoinase B